jgi:multimeric flavodoxin WrbA
MTDKSVRHEKAKRAKRMTKPETADMGDDQEPRMKVLLVNGSPHAKGCTYTALEEVAKTLNAEGIETEIYQIGTKPLSGCTACGSCRENGRCKIPDRVNEFLDIAANADGFVFGSPVHFAAAGGAITSFMDRVFFAGMRSAGRIFRLKPAAAVVSARRAGTTAAFDQLNKYFTISEMPVISSKYWNNVHGFTPEDVRKDLEGLQVMRVLGRNMAWFLKCKKAGIKAGVPFPEREEPVSTNFIR